MNIGGLYQAKKYSWLLFPSKELAKERASSSCRSISAAFNADYYSRKYNCIVNFLETNSCFLLLEELEPCYKVLDTNGNIGWIGCLDFFMFFERVS